MFGSNVRRGTIITMVAALLGAAFLIPYKQASLLADARVVALALLATSAVWSTGVALAQMRGRWRLTRTSWMTALILAVLSVTGNVCSATALTTLDPGLTSVILRMQVVFILATGALVLGEKVPRSLGVGATLALAGVVLMRYPFSGQSSFVGILWAFGAATSFGSMVIVTRRVIHDIEPVAVNAIRLWIAVAVLALVPGTVASARQAPPSIWLFAAAAALCGPVASRLCIMFALRHITAGFQALIFLSAPAFAYGLGYLFFDAVPTAREAVGSLVILVGIAVPVIAALRVEARAALARADLGD